MLPNFFIRHTQSSLSGGIIDRPTPGYLPPDTDLRERNNRQKIRNEKILFLVQVPFGTAQAPAWRFTPKLIILLHRIAGRRFKPASTHQTAQVAN